jgi:hypothetical protein
MKPNPLFHRVRHATKEELKEQNRRYTRKGKKRKTVRSLRALQGGATGLKQQRHK